MSEGITLDQLFAAQNIDEIAGGLSFEHGLRLLEDLVAKVESGSLSLENSIASYEKGVRLIQYLKALLSGAEEKLRVLQKDALE